MSNLFLCLQLLVPLREVSIVNCFGMMWWRSCSWSNFWIESCYECDNVGCRCYRGFRIFGYIILRGYKWFYHITLIGSSSWWMHKGIFVSRWTSIIILLIVAVSIKLIFLFFRFGLILNNFFLLPFAFPTLAWKI